jgi:hypothetical protein
MVCFSGTSLILTIIPSIGNDYGEAGAWCWLKNETTAAKVLCSLKYSFDVVSIEVWPLSRTVICFVCKICLEAEHLLLNSSQIYFVSSKVAVIVAFVSIFTSILSMSGATSDH